MAAASSSNSGQAAKVPRHFWWTKRIFLAWLLLAAALLVSRFVWNWKADRRVEAEKAAILARGEEWDWTKMAPPYLAAEDNRATYYSRAAAIMDMSSVGGIGGFGEDYLLGTVKVASMRGKYDAQITALLAANEQAFAECRAARKVKGVNWGIDHAAVPSFDKPLASFGFPSFKSYRPMAKLLCLKAMWQVQHGDSQGAIETLLDAEVLARALSEDTRLIGYLVSIASQGLADKAVAWVAPSIAVEGQGATAASRPATVESARQLIHVLLDGHATASCPRNLLAERADFLGAISRMSTTELFDWENRTTGIFGRKRIARPPEVCNWPLAPMYQVGVSQMLHRFGQLIDACGQPTRALVGRRLPSKLPETPGSLEGLRLLVPLSADSLVRVADLEFEAEAQSRLAAAALALRLYELEKGRPAKSLDELVPEYLPAVPGDPFDPEGGPIRARLTDARPRVYSVGEDFRDDGGLPPDVRVASGEWSDDIIVYLRLPDMPEPDLSSYSGFLPPQLAPQAQPQDTTDPASQPAAD